MDAVSKMSLLETVRQGVASKGEDLSPEQWAQVMANPSTQKFFGDIAQQRGEGDATFQQINALVGNRQLPDLRKEIGDTDKQIMEAVQEAKKEYAAAAAAAFKELGEAITESTRQAAKLEFEKAAQMQQIQRGGI